jgi:hypothetical protein
VRTRLRHALEVWEMPGTEGLLELAGIAGVFVGFGALIAVRSGGASDAFEVAFMRGVVVLGALTIVSALAPVTFARYPLADHEVWALSSVVVVAGLLGSLVTLTRTEGGVELELPARIATVSRVAWVLCLIAIFLAPIVIMLGLAPDLEASLYFTVVVLILAWDAFLLLQLVFRPRRPAEA